MLTRYAFLTWLMSLATSSPVGNINGRAVAELNQEATAEAHQRDDGATRALSNTQIQTSDGRCLFVDKLSGDFRANLTPIQVASCGTTDGDGWDVITAGKHNNAAGSALIVSTLTQACFNFDPRRKAGNQVVLFSCGGRAAGEGLVTDSQLFPFTNSIGSISFQPKNQPGSCFTVKDNTIDIAPCNSADVNQSFTFGNTATGGNNAIDAPAESSSSQSGAATTSLAATSSSLKASPTAPAASSAASTPNTPAVTNAPEVGGQGIPNPTTPVPVSRAGNTLNPSDAAESHQQDTTAIRFFTSVSLQASNGQCLFVNPTAGDFRQNLIPVSLVECGGTPNEKFDFVTQGKHNNAKDGGALIVSSLMNGCINFDGRRAQGDTVTIFSCGGRANGEGETQNGQLFDFGSTEMVLAPLSEKNATCLVPGNERLESAPCTNDGSQLFTILA